MYKINCTLLYFSMKILLTGGLGYIGSHIAHLVGSSAVIIDNLSNSKLNYKKFLPKAVVFKRDLNQSLLKKIFSQYDIQGVIHLASLKAVNQSIKNPLQYYNNNVAKSLEMLEAMDKFKIQKLIFSSSATVYGSLHKSPLNENLSLQSVNPYGSTKIIIEQMIDDYAKSNLKFRAISLRYFNPLGANIEAGLSDQPLGEPQNIMPILINKVSDKKIFNIFGNDYPTYDGTCVRDYIHIKDLAKAHILALNKLNKFKGHTKINIGLGRGISVLDLISAFEKVNNIKVDYKIANRRMGDAAVSYASNQKAKKLLNWKPKYTIQEMVKDAWEAHKKKFKQ